MDSTCHSSKKLGDHIKAPSSIKMNVPHGVRQDNNQGSQPRGGGLLAARNNREETMATKAEANQAAISWLDVDKGGARGNNSGCMNLDSIFTREGRDGRPGIDTHPSTLKTFDNLKYYPNYRCGYDADHDSWECPYHPP